MTKQRTRWTALKESVFGVSEHNPILVKYNKTPVLGIVQQGYTIFVTNPSFAEQVNVYNSDSVLKEAIDDFAEQVVMTGFFLTMNPKYTLVLNGKTAKAFIEDWNRSNSMQEKAKQIAIELQAYGNSFWQVTPEEGYTNIPVEAIWRALPVDPKIALQNRYNVQLTPMYGAVTIPMDEFIHFRTHVKSVGHSYSGSAPFGIGLISPMLARPTTQDGSIIAPSIYEMRLALRTDLMEGFKKFSFGNSVYSFPGLSNDDFAASGLADLISGMASTGNRIATNAECKISLEVPERTQSYDEFIKRMSDEFMMSIADPALKMGLEMGFTKSTAIAGMELFKYKIESMRRIIASQFEELWSEILDNSGYDGKEAKISMVFGQETTEYVMPDVFSAVDRKIISADEARVILQKYFKWEISGPAPKPIVSTGNSGTSTPAAKTENLASVRGTMATEAEIPDIVIVELSNGIAGYNKEGTKIFIDPLVPEWMHKPLIAHEVYEIGMLELGYTYEKAHAMAVEYEKVVAEKIGLDWSKYDSEFKSLLPKIKARASKNPEDMVIHQ